ncbi:hypothetical protein EHW97_07415 [Aeromicrobium camelliae]|uniref:Peptidase C39 domain-containing protein n=1 Tax=Aeromicrobium camelliae TaxID=1538144 RepID=A0A3N6ZM66_9ACTN|nr:hypothetical protein [Aeromicrobium camelliae]RQN08137.1 hypothetical protein EHW97_07415 [Aeromicrobium camelliae]
MTPAGAPIPRIVQPDTRTCGPSAILAAAIALRGEPSVGRSQAVHVLHRRLASARRSDGGWRLPWPRALGTSPWAAAHELGAVSGETYAWRLVRHRRLDREFAKLAASTQPALLYVGSAVLPRHVVLIAEVNEDALRILDPASGRIVARDRSAFVDRRLRLSGWDVPWLVVSRRGDESHEAP